MEFCFTLKYQLSETDADPDDLVERLAAAGCDDALVGIGRPGRLALEFTREATSAQEALVSALSDVKEAIPTAKLVEAAPDFVGLTDIADVMGVSRQNMRKLWVTHSAHFPIPVHEGAATVWHLADVLAWLEKRGNKQLPASVFEVARTTKQINLAKQLQQLAPMFGQSVEALLS